MKKLILSFAFLPGLLIAATEEIPLLSAHVDLTDKPSLQRGAKWYMNYCAGCHALSYQRYQRTAHDIGVAHYTGEADQKLMTKNLIFTGAKFGDRMENAMSTTDAKQWFGVAPPDLTLETRVRGADWVYTYLLNFYVDNKAPWGTNNRLFPGVAMPHVLVNLQGRQIPVYHRTRTTVDGVTKTADTIDHLQSVQAGAMAPLEYEKMVHDIVNFLAYVGTPNKTKREFLGLFVLAFLLVMVVLTYALKRDFWRELKNPKPK